jgi:hypothetical protein
VAGAPAAYRPPPARRSPVVARAPSRTHAGARARRRPGRRRHAAPSKHRAGRTGAKPAPQPAPQAVLAPTNARRPQPSPAAPSRSAVTAPSPARRAFSLLYIVPLALLLSPFVVGPLVGRLRAIR